MMNIAAYSLCRDRLSYSRYCFDLLRKNAGTPFDHFVVDNGSTDGTAEWLEREYRPAWLWLNPTNLGISRASNLALDAIFRSGHYRAVVKLDNDCEVLEPDTLKRACEALEELNAKPLGSRWVISPRVEGIAHQPKRVREEFWTKNYRVGETSIIGGLFHVVPADIYARYRYPENMPLAKGQDDHFCQWIRGQGGHLGYVENVAVNHYRTTDGQCKDFPEYFHRKWAEESTLPR